MARVPPAEGGGDPELVEFGIPVVAERLEEAEVAFPATAGELEAALGDAEIPYDAAGRTVALSAALREVDAEEFESAHELLDALHPVLEGHREGAASGLLDRLRGLLPR